MNIPKYRAKKIDSDEYVVGFLVPLWSLLCEAYAINQGNMYDNNDQSLDTYQIDPSTLAINFPDMLDSDNTPIFASLSEDGKGGDTYLDCKCCQRPISFIFSSTGVLSYFENYSDYKIYGIKD